MVAIAAKDKPKSDHSDQDCVPLSALQMPDESEQMQAPEVGDKVQYTVEGTVARIDGDEAYVDRDTINGQPFDNKGPGDQNPAQSDQDSQDGDQGAGYGDLQQMAQNTQLQ